jgi:hypothetical protein
MIYKVQSKMQSIFNIYHFVSHKIEGTYKNKADAIGHQYVLFADHLAKLILKQETELKLFEIIEEIE